MTIIEIINTKIFDQVIDGTEYQLIKRGDLIQTLENEGILLSTQDLSLLRDIIKPIWIDAINVKNLEEIMKSFGITEDYPPINRHLDYSRLTGPTIRMFNRIIQFMADNHITDITDVISRDKIQQVRIASKTKEDVIDIISPIDLEIEFRKQGVIKRSEHLDQEFTDFIELDSNNEDKIMIRKLKKCINDIKNSTYFQRFGTTQRKLKPNVTNNALRKASTQYKILDYSDKIDKSIIKVEFNFESKFQKAKANLSILKWKAVMLKNSNVAEILENNKSINQQSSKQNYLDVSQPNKDNQLFESHDSFSSDLFDTKSINKELKRKRFGLA